MSPTSGRLLTAGGLVLSMAAGILWLWGGVLPEKIGTSKSVGTGSDRPADRDLAVIKPLEPSPSVPPASTPDLQGSRQVDLRGLPDVLLAFVKSRDTAFLFDQAGNAIPAQSQIDSAQALWQLLAATLSQDPEASREVIRWLSQQRQQPTAVAAMAHFWGASLGEGAGPNLTDADLQTVRESLAQSEAAVDLQMLAGLSAARSLPEPFLQDLQQRILAQPTLAQKLTALTLDAKDMDQARALIALGDSEFQWKMLSAASPASIAQAAAVEALLDQTDAEWIDRLLSYASAGLTGFSSQVSAQWAQRHLSGERLARLEQLMADGAFAGSKEALIDVLLSNAEDQEGAIALAERQNRPSSFPAKKS